MGVRFTLKANDGCKFSENSVQANNFSDSNIDFIYICAGENYS